MKREPVHLDARKGMNPARRRRILEQHGGMCAYPECFVCTELEIDHQIPLALGGRDSDENCWPLCRMHHRQKTILDVKMIAKAKRLVRKESPETRKPSTLRGRPFQTGIKQKIASRPFDRKKK